MDSNSNSFLSSTLASGQFPLLDQRLEQNPETPQADLQAQGSSAQIHDRTVETTSATMERTSAIDAGFWRKVVDNLSAMNPENKLFRTWLSATSLDDLEPTESGVRFVIGVPSNLHKNFIEGYLDRFLPEIRAHYPGPFSIEIRVTNKTVAQEPTTVDEYLYQQEQQHFRTEHREDGIDHPAHTLGPKPAPSMNEPRPDMTFQTFVVGSTNEFAYTASRAIAEQPSSLYNPLFLVGPTGLGKTHLLFAIWNQLRASFPQLRVTYVAADRFLSEFLKHLRKNTAYEFQQKYREQCDVLLIDDIHILSRGERIQEEFFQTFNHFSLSRKQVVVTSDRLPRDIAGLEDRIRTRLEGGLIADIKMPDFETRLSILRSKAESKRLPIDESVLQYIAKVSKRSVRELEGNLNKIEILVSLYNKPVTLESAKQVLALDAEGNQISMEDIEKLVADFYKLRVNDLRGSARPKPIVTARQVAMFLIKKNLPNKSLVEIGRHFGNRDHTTVMNSLERIQDQVITNLDLKRDIDDLQGRIHNITGV